MMYMAGNNSLSAFAFENLNQIEEGFKDIDGKFIVYARIFGQLPTLYEIQHDQDPNKVNSKILKTYQNHDSSDPHVIKMIFSDMKSLAPAKSYGAILWSHATNWAPAASPSNEIKTRSFGDDDFSHMDIQDLSWALPTDLDFLLFDACLMASVEVLYELRNQSPYILASPTEVLDEGMPYQKITPWLFSKEIQPALIQIAQQNIAYYKQKSGLEQSASYAVIVTKKLNQLAIATKKLLSSHNSIIPEIDRDKLQRMDFDPSTPIVAYDYLDFIEQNFPKNALAEIQEILPELIIYKAHTNSFLGKPIEKFSGLSCYVPNESEAKKYQDFYQSLAWAQQAAYMQLFYW